MTYVQEVPPSAHLLHLSIPVHDLDEARHFYVDVLGCEPGRVRPGWLDVWFFGMQLTLQHRPDEVREPDRQGVLHFGVTLNDAATFRAVVDRLSANEVRWLSRPALHAGDELSGKLGGKVADPSGNVVEIKYYEDVAKIRPAAAGLAESAAARPAGGPWGERLRVTGVDHVVLLSTDVERTVAWYRNHLGLGVERLDEWRAGTVPFPSLRLSETSIIDVLSGERTGQNVDHIALVVEDIDLDELASSGRFDVVSGPSDLWGARGRGRGLYVRDPDANLIELRTYS